MPKLSISPTRMEMLKLKKRLNTAELGHKLLKDKRNGLMKEFIETIKEVRQIRKEIEPELQIAFTNFVFAASYYPLETKESLLIPRKKVSLLADTKNVMGVNIPVFTYTEEENSLSYSLARTPVDLDEAIQVFSKILKKIVLLAKIEHSAKLLAIEIEKTRRRVNALEYVFIPNIKETIKYIQAKISEEERATLIILMKVKKQQQYK